jgi:hypothetical protein
MTMVSVYRICFGLPFYKHFGSGQRNMVTYYVDNIFYYAMAELNLLALWTYSHVKR